MNKKIAQTDEIINERFMKLHSSVYHQMMNAEKNEYDPDITLPPCHMIKDMPLKKQYDLSNKVDDTQKKEQRRRNHRSVLENCIINDKQYDAKRMIKKSYYTSITEISKEAEKSDTRYICNQKTARKLIKKLLQLIGYDGEISIPKILTDDILECIKKWAPQKKTLYKCCNEPEKLLDYMNEAEMVYIYDFYRIVKQMILMECDSKQEYKNRVACLHKNKKLKAIYNAVRTINE